MASLSLLACRTPSSKIPLEQLKADEQEQTQGEAREAVEPLPVERPTDLLPPEVPILAEAIDPASVLALIGPLDKYPELDNARAELRGQLGGDILDPDQWHQLALDSHGPAGIGVLDVHSTSFFAYLSLTDPQKFDQTVRRLADMFGMAQGEFFDVTEVAGARVYRLYREFHVVVRDRIALLIFSQDHGEVPRDYVVTAATIDPRESLGHSERFVWARQQLQPADDGMVFISPPELLVQIERAESSDSDYGIRYAEEELARARSSGASPDAIRELEARVAEERRWQSERQARDVAERELTQALFGSVHAFVGAADLRTDGIVGHARASMASGNVLRRLLLPPERESPLLTSLGEPPVFALDGRVDLQVLLELVELLARTDGHTLAEANREVQAEIGVDMLSVIAALTGEGGIMLTEARKVDLKKLDAVPKSLGLAAYANLKDPDAIRQLLDGIARDKLLSGALTRAKRGDGWLLRVPEWNDVELAIVGDRLVLATDTKLAGRIRNAERGAQADALAAADHPLRGPLASPAARFYWRMVGFVLLDAREPYLQDAETMLYDYNTHHALTPDEAAKVPRSRDFKRKLGELQKAVDELNAFNVRRTQREFQRELDFANGLGDLGIQVEPQADGLAFAGHWRFASGTTPLELGFAWFRAIDSSDDWAEYDRLSMRANDLVNELRVIRQADLDAAAAKRAQ
ncbi:MAG TPA: hypothetical protein VM869_28525 [Enhygromyxa sp.]|nr:hypothetical protein [Enhygromyxa sp.]